MLGTCITECCSLCSVWFNSIRIEGRIEKSVPRIAVWHHEACRVMTNGDPERGPDFSILPSHEYWILFPAHHCIYLFVFK